MRCTYRDRRADRKGSGEAFFNFRYGKKKKKRKKNREDVEGGMGTTCLQAVVDGRFQY
jgi:hypothetical protein